MKELAVMPPLPERPGSPAVAESLAGGGEMGERVRAFDWSQTPLEAIAGWPQSLKTAVRILLNSRYPMFLWWGPELTNIYNDAYVPILGARHPQALGRSAPRIWAEIWDVIGPQAEVVLREGRATWNESVLLVMERYGFTEETYFTFSYSPAPMDSGAVGGVFCACTEDTRQILGERRLRILRDLGERSLAASRSAEGICRAAAATLATNPHDFPFVLIYLLDENGETAHLRGAASPPAGSTASPAKVAVSAEDAWGFGRVIATGKEQIVDDLEARGGRHPAGPWTDDWTRRALVLPLARAGSQETPAGFLVAGLSPRLAFDADYRGFLQLTAGQLATALANALAYEQERKRAEALAELDRAKTEFFSNVSHEFRTPLTLMLGPLEDLLDEAAALPPAARERLGLAHRNSLRLLKLVNTLLDFSRIEAGRLQAAFEPVDLAALTAELASVFRSAIERAGLRLLVSCPRLPEPVYVDRDMWEKIVLNLLSNAFKYTFEGEIEVSLRAHGEVAELRVRDTGTGIPADELPHLFERFHRVRGARARSFEGSGIGLSLVQQLAKLHGGSVSVASEVERGSTFTVAIPLGKAHLPADRIRTKPSVSARSRSAPYVEEVLRWLPLETADGAAHLEREDAEPRLEAEPGAPRPPILLADDNADMRDYVRRLLGRRYEVVAVADGAAALEAARKQAFELVLADVMMPHLDGFGLLAELRADEQTKTLPVILLSARAGEESRVEGLAAGADDYLVKPFSARELLARVEAHRKLHRERRAAMEALRESDRRKDEFLALLAHELRNPLAPIRNAAQVLKLIGKENAKQRWAREVIERQAQHLTRLVDDLLDVSRITRGKIELAREVVDLESILKRAVETSQPQIDEKRHRLTLVMPSEPIRLEGDRIRLVQIFGNLLHNAAKYTDEGGRIRLQAGQDSGEAVVGVRDDGIGLSPDLLPHVFDLFAQADHSLDRSQGGLGIGLTLVQQLVELHGGRVEARSDGLGRGSEFIVRLPVLDPSVAPGAKEAPVKQRHHPANPPLKVLVVEDQPDSAMTLELLLELRGHDVRTVRDGSAALGEAGRFEPDVVLCDIGLPGMSGYEIAQRLRARPAMAQTALVAVTGYGHAEARARAREVGFDDYLVKPIEPEALDALLDTLRDGREGPGGSRDLALD